MKVPLRQQIAAVELEIEQRKVSRGCMSRSEHEYQLLRLGAVLTTLKWFQANEPRIREKVGENETA